MQIFGGLSESWVSQPVQMEAKHEQTRDCPHHWHMQPSGRAVNMRKQTRKDSLAPIQVPCSGAGNSQPRDTCWHAVHGHGNTNTQETLFLLTSCKSPWYLNKKPSPSQMRCCSKKGFCILYIHPTDWTCTMQICFQKIYSFHSLF